MCDDPDGAEIIFAVDNDLSATAEQFSALKSSILGQIDQMVPQGERFGLISFSDRARIVVPLHSENRQFWPTLIQNMGQATGQGSMLVGLQAGLNTFSDEDVAKILVVYYDGDSTTPSTDVCGQVSIPHGVKVILAPIGIPAEGVLDQLQITACLTQESPLLNFSPFGTYELMTDYTELVGFACGEKTPYNGDYTNNIPDRAGKLAFSNGTAEFFSTSEVWFIQTQVANIFMTSSDSPGGILPPAEDNYQWTLDNMVCAQNGDCGRYLSVYTKCMTCCKGDTAEPSYAPSVSPSVSLPTEDPVAAPKLPTVSPVASDPSVAPTKSTTVEPTEVPSSRPSVHPVEVKGCEVLSADISRNCDREESLMDIIFAIDTSSISLVDLSTVTAAMQNVIDTVVPAQARIGLISYGPNVTEVKSISRNHANAKDALATFPTIAGETASLVQAGNLALQMFEDVRPAPTDPLNPYQRDNVIVFLATNIDNTCSSSGAGDFINLLNEREVSTWVYNIEPSGQRNDNQYGCMVRDNKHDGIYVETAWANIAAPTFQNVICNTQDPEQPIFTGEFTRSINKVNGKYEYYASGTTGPNYQLEYVDEAWILVDQTGQYGQLISRNAEFDIPQDFGSWDYVHGGEFATYTRVRFFCGGPLQPTAAPTRHDPTVFPSHIPTRPPITSRPTVSPSEAPTNCYDQCEHFTLRRDNKCSSPTDVVFAVDSSSSIKSSEYCGY
jgi:Mg-chelatase subunit ChlD